MGFADLLAWSLARKAREEAVAEGLKAAIQLYYDDNEDADELDPRFVGALTDLANRLPNWGDDEVFEIIRDVEKEMLSDWPRPRHVRTAMAYGDEDDDGT